MNSITREEAIKMAKARLTCLKYSTSAINEVCNNDCSNCVLNYEQGTIGEQKEWLEIAIDDMKTVQAL